MSAKNICLENKPLEAKAVVVRIFTFAFEPHREKTGFLPRRKQRRRSASR